MKKLLLLTIALTMLASCQKGDEPKPDESTLVSGIVMPAGEFMTNDQVTINGAGFLDGDAIVLRSAAKSSDIDAVVTEVTESQLVFMMPAGVAAGKMNVVLKRDVKKQILGEIAVVDMPPMQLYGIGATPKFPYSPNSLYKIDMRTGKAVWLMTFPDCYHISSMFAIGHTLYGNIISPRGYIVSYNLDTKEYKDLTGYPQLSSLNPGWIDGKLRWLAVDNGVRLRAFEDTTGDQVDLINFGRLNHDFGVGGYIQWGDFRSSGAFAYDAKNKKIAMVSAWQRYETSPFDREYDWYYNITVFDIAKQTVEYFADEKYVPSNYNLGTLFYKDSQLYLTRWLHNTPNGTALFDISKLDDQYQISETLVTIDDKISAFKFDDVTNVGYGYSKAGLFSIDLNTTPAKINIIGEPNSYINAIVVVR